LTVALRSKFTRIPKISDFVLAGIPAEVIPTYCALADYTNNKTGLCWPRMETLAKRLSRSPRTIQRHLHLLKEKGLVEFVERKRDARGRFGAYLYRLLHIAAATARGEGRGTTERQQPYKRGSKKRLTTGHQRPVAPNKGLTKHEEVPPIPPRKDYKRGYWWLFSEEPPPGAEEEHQKEVKKRREEEAQKRTEGSEWIFE
jgi:DNA-binding transcriptional ArsR family regulator